MGKRLLLGALFGTAFFALEFSFLGELRSIAGIWAWLAVGGMALFGALWGAILGLLSTNGNPLYLAAVWTGLEILRSSGPWGVVFGTLPAALAGQPFLPAASVIGPWGMGFLTALTNASLAQGIGERRWLGCSLVGPVVLGVLALTWSQPQPTGELRVALVQPGVSLPQRLQEPPESLLKVYLDLLRELTPPLDLVLLPEDALPVFLRLRPDLLTPLREEASRLEAPLILGSWVQEGGRYYNAALVITPAGRLEVVHRKVKLLPFGEYLPGRKLWEILGFGALLQEVFPQDLSPGKGLFPWRHYGILICSESQFPWLFRRLGNEGAEIFLVLTNDSWFGRFRLLREHYTLLALRAAETGRAVLQAAVTGITGGFAPGGKELGRIRGERGTLLLRVPLCRHLTPYIRSGDLPLWVILATLFVLGQWTRIRRLQLSERP